MPLTGKFSFRRSLTGKVVLTVEEEVRSLWPWSPKGATRTRWRNASLWDLTHPEIRHLLELRDGTKPAATSAPQASEAVRPQRSTETALLDGMSWRYASPDENGNRRANGH